MNDAGTSPPRSAKEIFFAALDQRTPEERAAFLVAACGANPVLRAKVEALLADHFHRDAFMQRPAVAGDGPTLQQDPAPEATSAQVIGRYTLLEVIGEGGFGEVWMAEQREPVKRRVALKIIKLGMDSRQIVARFEAERQALAMMDHPNIAKIFDAGTTATGRPYFVMELVPGIQITEYCDQHRLPTFDRLKPFIEVCQAVQHAHQKGVIHRDLKPSNILVTLHDGVALPKVIDFGIAKATEQALTDKTVVTQFQQFLGTPAYISPEQAEMSGLDLDTRADIYSLGVLLYELLVGQTPFDAQELLKDGLDTLRQIIREREPLRPSTRLNTLPGEARTTAGQRRQTDVSKLVHQLEGDLDWIVMKCLEKDRTRRYATANGLAMDLRRHLDCEPVLARPPSQLYRFRKFARRNRVTLAAITSVAVALLLGVVVSTWQAIRATRASASETVQHKLADLQVALQSWEEGDLQRASELIEDCRPAPGQAPSFEWRYLQKLCQDQSLDTFGNTNHPCRAAMFFERDSLLLNEAKTLTLLDLSRRTTQLLLEDPDGISSPESCAGNTNRLATVTDDGRIKVWDLVARRVQVELAGQPRAPLASAAQFHTLTLARDGRRLAWAGSDYSVKLWDVEARNPKPVRTLHRYASWACSPVFSSDGRHLFSGGSESTIRTWNAATGEAEGTPLEGHTSWVYALALSPDGLRLASGGADSAIIIWDVLTRKPVTTLFGHMAWVSALAFSPDGQRLASGGGDHTIRLWNLKTSQHLSLLRGQGAALTWLSFSPDGQWLVSRSRDGLVKRWRTTPDQEANTLTGGQSSLEVAWSPDGRRLAAVGGSDFGVSLWDLPTRSSTRLLCHTGAAMYAAFSPDGRMLATASHDQTVRLWDVSNHQVVATLTNDFPVGSLAFSPDGQTLIVGGSKHHFLVGDRGGLQFWDVSSRQPTGGLPGDASDIVQVALSDPGTLLATGHTNGPVSLWNAHTRRLLHRFESQFGSSVLSLAFSPTEPLLAASDRAGHIVLYNTATLKVVPPPLKGHTGRVTSLAFSPDGQTLASAGEGGGLKLWHVATHQVALTLKGHRSAVKGIAFSRDGNFLASCALDGTVRLWPAADLETDAAAKVLEKPTIKQP